VRKKRVLFHSDFALAKTGFGRVMKTLLSHLFKSDKYEIYHYCCGMQEGDPALKATPWKSLGSLPSSKEELSELSKDQNAARAAGYGSFSIDKVVAEIKPDVYIGVQDWWGVDYVLDKKWFKNLECALWVTLDSLPILKGARENAHKVKNFWVWSNFAEKAMKKEGISHVKTVHGPIESKHFKRLPDSQRQELRKKFNLPSDAFVIGFVFRNQLRKLVPNVMEGYALWRKNHPEVKNPRLLLHTSFSEGWNIKDQADIHGVDTREILTTYICRHCKSYEVKSFDDRTEKYQRTEGGEILMDAAGRPIEVPLDPQNKPCKFCGQKSSQVTTGVGFGITEEELNEVYNLMDVYLHALTSGGQEIPIQEAKMTELVTLVTNYSCGEEACDPAAKSLPLDWAKYIEHGTEFIKASTYPSSIAKQLNKFYNLPDGEKRKWGKEARSWALDQYSIESIGKFFEDFIDAAPLLDESNGGLYASASSHVNPHAEIPEPKNDLDWILLLYKLILDRNESPSDDGVKYWMSEINKGTSKQKIEEYFRYVAVKTLSDGKKSGWKSDLKSQVKKEDGKKDLIYVAPHSDQDFVYTISILNKLRQIYPASSWRIYLASDNLDAFAPYVGELFDYYLEYNSNMDQSSDLEEEGVFDVAFCPYVQSKRLQNYQHNGEDQLYLI